MGGSGVRALLVGGGRSDVGLFPSISIPITQRWARTGLKPPSKFRDLILEAHCSPCSSRSVSFSFPVPQWLAKEAYIYGPRFVGLSFAFAYSISISAPFTPSAHAHSLAPVAEKEHRLR